MTSSMLFVLRLLLLLEALRVNGQDATSKKCNSRGLWPHGYINCSSNPCQVTCRKGSVLSGPKTVKCLNGVLVNWRRSKCYGVRLVGWSKRAASGRIHISTTAYTGYIWNYYSYTNNTSDKGWSLREAAVVCRMFGLPTASYAIGRAPSSDKAFFFLPYLRCKGNESSISECSNSELKYPNFNLHLKDEGKNAAVGVVCGDAQISVRLTGFTSNIRAKTQELGIPRVGKVELDIDGFAAAISANHWNDSAAQVACHGLNISGPCVAPSYYMTEQTSKVWLEKVGCSGKEKSILDCINPDVPNVRQIGSASAGVVAVGYLKPEISLRITGGHYDQEGTVEADINGVMVFLDVTKGNEQNVSKVICRSLGLPPPIMFFQAAKWVYLQDHGYKDYIRIGLQCTGKEQNISACKTRFHSTWTSPFAALHGVACKREYQCPSGCTCKWITMQDTKRYNGMKGPFEYVI